MPVEAIDTNGAGDVFAGAMIFATLKNWPVDRRMRFAAAAAALKSKSMGNRGALPSLEQIESTLAEEH